MPPATTVNPDSDLLTETVFEHFQGRHPDLPPWLLQQKRQSWMEYRSLPLPNRKMESWRFSNVRGLGVDPFALANPINGHSRAALVARSQDLDSCAGRMVFGNDDLLENSPLSWEMTEKGVIFEPLQTAFSKHSEILEEFFMAQKSALGSEKFAALHTTLNRNGTLLYVPEKVEIRLPLVSRHWAFGENAAVFPHTLLIARDQARVVFVDVYSSSETSSRQFACGVSTVYAGSGAEVEYHHVQNWGERSLSFNTLTAIAQRNSRIRAFGMNLGSKYSRNEGHSIIEGPASNAEFYSLTLSHLDQEMDQRTRQTHRAPHARSNLLFKNALLDSSKTIFSGLIKVDKAAQQTDAYQTNRNLLLSPKAEANSMPGLEILANDVKCSHGATTGQLDDNQLFYFLSRGIGKLAAQKLLVFGFFEEVLEKIDNRELAEFHRRLVQEKFKRS